MTPDQESQFNDYGCIPRCLIQLAERIGKPIGKQDFCDRFAHRFHNPQKQYGLLDSDHIAEIACSLCLPGEKGAPPKNISFVDDYDQLATLHKTGSLILIASYINLKEGATDPSGHCSVLHAIDSKSFTLWTPSQDGKDYIIPPFQRSDWAGKKCRGIVFI